MKKILLIALVFVPILMFGQRMNPVIDSLTAESDTIVWYHLSTSDYFASWYVKCDTLEGGTDGTIELVVCNDGLTDAEWYALGKPNPADSLAARLTDNMTKTLTTVGAYPFYDPDGTVFEWYGLRFTVGSVTKWHLWWEFIYQKK